MDNKWLKILVHASTWFAPVLVPLVVYLVAEEREVKKLSLQALVFHIVMGILIGISGIFSFILIGIPFLIFFLATSLVAPILGIIRAWQDRAFDYPVIGSFIR
jgi:hypothetical protein